jgi:serine/threonine protein phosphatase PrpC
MGGHSGGKYASTMVLETIRAAMEDDLEDPRISSDDLSKKLVQSVQEANTELFYENEKYGVFCGTTVTGAILIEQPVTMTQAASTYIAHVVNVGDSRTYCHSKTNGFSRITRDHSVVEEMVALGVIRPEERYTHKDRNKIYRCIGEKVTVEVDTFTLTLQQGDQLLLCSDGLWEMVRDHDLASFFASEISEPSMITPHLIQAALNRGGSDNVTAVVVMAAGEARYLQTLHQQSAVYH